MDAQPGSNSLRTKLNVLLLLLIVVSLGRLAVVVPGWVGGATPAYRGQYESELFSFLASFPMLSAVLLIQRSLPRTLGWGRVTLVCALMAISLISVLVDISRD